MIKKKPAIIGTYAWIEKASRTTVERLQQWLVFLLKIIYPLILYKTLILTIILMLENVGPG